MAHNLSLSSLSHPDFTADVDRWYEYRLTFEGGDEFMRQYLLDIPDETPKQLALRKLNTPIPAVAKDAVKDVRRSITQRMEDVVRSGGSAHYQAAVAGEGTGVDREGQSMNLFVGTDVLTELLVMGRVGVFVDNAPPQGPTMADGESRPYAYAYKVEDIVNWSMRRPEEEGTFSMVMLRDHKVDFTQAFGLNFPTNATERFRLCWIGDDGFMRYKFLDKNLSQMPAEVVGSEQKIEDDGSTVITALREIPFIMPALDQSLLADTAGYQRALMNIASNEVMFAINANNPMLLIQKDTRADAQQWKKPPGGNGEPGGQRSRDASVRTGIRSGWVTGRFFGPDEVAPTWLSMPVDSLKGSSEYREKLADEIRQLINVAVQNQTGTRSESRETREISAQGLESGLHFIAMKLQNLETQIGKYMTMYEKGTKFPVITYPKRYNLLSDEQRIINAKAFIEVTNQLPGQPVKKEGAKKVIRDLFTGKVSSNKMTEMTSAVEKHPFIGDFDNIMAMKEGALISDETAAGSQDLPKKEVEQGRKDRAEQIKVTMEAQTPPGETPGASPDRPAARGAPELDADKSSGKTERAEDTQKRGEQKAKKDGE